MSIAHTYEIGDTIPDQNGNNLVIADMDYVEDSSDYSWSIRFTFEDGTTVEVGEYDSLSLIHRGDRT